MQPRVRFSARRLMISLMLFLVMMALILVYQPQVSGHEVSLYSNVPVLAWICLIGAFCLVAGLFISSAVASRESKATTWLSLAALFSISLIALSLAAIRYGPMYGTFDNWNHLGYSQDAKRTGHVNLELDYYPQLHVLTLILSETSFLSLDQLYKVVMPLLFSLRVPLTYLIARLLLRDRLSVAVATLLSAVNDITMLGVMAAPFTQSLILVLWILLAVLYSSRSFGFQLVLLVFVLNLAPAHILSSLMLAVFLIISGLLGRVMGNRINYPSKSFTIYLGVFVLVCGLGWLFYVTSIYGAPVRLVYQAMTFTLSPESALRVQAFQEHPSLSDPGFFLRLWLSPAIKIALSLLAIVIVLRKVLRKRSIDGPGEFDLALLSSWILVLVPLYVYTDLFITGTAFSSERMIYASLMLVPIYAGYGLRIILHKVEKHRGILVLSVVALAGLCFTSGFFVLYPSPYVKLGNSQTTEQQIIGIRWLVDRANPPTEIWGGDQNSAIAAGLFGYNFVYKEALVLYRSENFSQSNARLLSYLGYDRSIEGIEIGSSIGKSFIIINPTDKEIGMRGVKITDKDVQILHGNPADNLIYLSGEYSIHLHSGARDNE